MPTQFKVTRHIDGWYSVGNFVQDYTIMGNILWSRYYPSLGPSAVRSTDALAHSIRAAIEADRTAAARSLVSSQVTP